MKKRLALFMAAIVLLSACGGAKGESAPAAGQEGAATEQGAAAEVTEDAEPVPTEEPTPTEEPKRPDLLSWQPAWQQSLATVIRDEQAAYGKPSFTMDNISRAMGLGLVRARDLDGDGQEELVIIREDQTPEGWVTYVMEIWQGAAGGAKCLYTGTPYKMGADNKALELLEGEDGFIYVHYDKEDTMNGRYIGAVRGGAFEEVAAFDWESGEDGYDYENDAYLVGGKHYAILENYSLYCYNYGQETEDYRVWKNEIRDSYHAALQAVGLTKEDGAATYTPGLSSLLDDEYLRVKVTYVDPQGTVSSVREYDYDDAGRQVRAYTDDVLRTESTYNDAGILTHEVNYRKTGIRSKEEIYDDRGNLLESIEYGDDGNRINWDYVYSYDDQGRMATAYMGIGGRKEYFYNNEGVMIEARTVDENTGEVLNTHTFELDEKGRHLAEYLNRDGMHLKFATWEYRDDGSWSEITWDYKAYDENADSYYLEGAEEVGSVADYDADGNMVKTTVYAFADYGSRERVIYTTEENTYDERGNVLRNVKTTYNKGIASYEEITENEWTDDNQLKKRTLTYHNYGYWDNLGETEREVSYVSYDAEFNEQGYKVHVYTRDCEDPYGTGEPYEDDEIFFLYENAFGDLMGMDY